MGLLLVSWAGPLLAAPPEVEPAERELLERLIEESGVRTSPPSPGFGRWVQDVAWSFMSWLGSFFDGIGAGEFLRTVSVFGARAVFYLAIALLVFLIIRWLLRRQWNAGPDAPSVRTVGQETAPGPETKRPRAEWNGLIEERLAAGDIAGACEALWWWLARGLTDGPVEPSWTSRELLVATGRHELRSEVRGLDRLIYGGGEPGADDVRQVWQALRDALGDTASNTEEPA